MGNWIRKAIVIAVLLALWEVGARMADAPLLFPTFIDVCQALADSITAGDGSLLEYTKETCKSLFAGFAIGALLQYSPYWPSTPSWASNSSQPSQALLHPCLR